MLSSGTPRVTRASSANFSASERRRRPASRRGTSRCRRSARTRSAAATPTPSRLPLARRRRRRRRRCFAGSAGRPPTASRSRRAAVVAVIVVRSASRCCREPIEPASTRSSAGMMSGGAHRSGVARGDLAVVCRPASGAARRGIKRCDATRVVSISAPPLLQSTSPPDDRSRSISPSPSRSRASNGASWRRRARPSPRPCRRLLSQRTRRASRRSPGPRLSPAFGRDAIRAPRAQRRRQDVIRFCA